jgi:hypothetical protein
MPELPARLRDVADAGLNGVEDYVSANREVLLARWAAFGGG